MEIVKEFIVKHLDLIDSQNFVELYNLTTVDTLNNYMLVGNNISKMTKVLLDCGFNPLEPPATKLPDFYLYEDKDVSNFVVPNNVEVIGRYSFFCCENLENLVLPEGLKRIERAAFRLCPKLEFVKIPDSVVSIDFSFSRNTNMLVSHKLSNDVLDYLEFKNCRYTFID